MDDVDVESLVEELRAQVEERRRSGAHPPALQDRLEAEFDAILDLAKRPVVSADRVRQIRDRIRAVVEPDEAVDGSPAAGRSRTRAVARRAVDRAIAPLAATVRAIGTDAAEALDELSALIDQLGTEERRALVDAVTLVRNRIAVVDHIAEAVVDLEDRVAALEAKASATATE